MAKAWCRCTLRRLGPFVALTVAAHALLLTMPLRRAAAAGAAAPSTMQARLIAPDLSPLRAVAAMAAAAPTAAPPRQEMPPPVPAAKVPVESGPSQGIGLPGRADDDEQFFARTRLSIAPEPTVPVVIVAPLLSAAAKRVCGELTVFIDETGLVVRVRAEDNRLPPALAEAARKAFMSVRFRPGELIELGPVKSRICVEVQFDGGVPLLAS
jgi:hypothetical protein